MKTVVLGPQPEEVQTLIQRRRSLGIDTFDEVWEGSYHVAPAPNAAHAYLDDVLAVLLHSYALAAGLVGTGPFNLGEPADYRVRLIAATTEGGRGAPGWPPRPSSWRSCRRMTRPTTSSASMPAAGSTNCWLPIPPTMQ